MPPARPSLEALVVETEHGPVIGSLDDGIAVFKGIPFAAPPFGANRFKPPQPPQPWSRPRPAQAFGPVVPQSPYPEPFRTMLGDAGEAGEDCLSLNVWTPERFLSLSRRAGEGQGGGLPVMVWIYGGAFLRGSSAIPTYDGRHFARDGVVFVSFNYRVGADGYLWTGEGPANFGLRDQLAALSWVQRNIDAFGGDPARVTVFGESAGAFSVAPLIAVAKSAGLFQRAILQSGAGHHVLSTATAHMVAAMLADRLSLPPSYEAMGDVPIDRFIDTQRALDLERAMNPDPARWGEVAVNGMMFEPVIDGELLHQRPIDAIEAGASAGLQILIGTTAEEWRFFTVPLSTIDLVTEDRVAGLARRCGLDPRESVARYRAANPGATAGDLYAAIITDFFFRIPAIRLAEAHARNQGPSHVYEFAWRSPMFDGRLGACHALELGFVFDNLDRAGPMRGEAPPQALADLMHRAWVRFAMDGDPGWPAYETARRQVMHFDGDGSRVVADPGGPTRELWEGIR